MLCILPEESVVRSEPRTSNRSGNTHRVLFSIDPGVGCCPTSFSPRVLWLIYICALLFPAPAALTGYDHRPCRVSGRTIGWPRRRTHGRVDWWILLWMDGFQAPEASQFMSLLFVCMFTFCVLGVQLYGGLVSPDPDSELNKKIAVRKTRRRSIFAVQKVFICGGIRTWGDAR